MGRPQASGRSAAAASVRGEGHPAAPVGGASYPAAVGNLGLGVLAVGPALCLVHVFWARDREREPLGNLLIYLGLGALSVVPAALVEVLTTPVFDATRGWLGPLLALALYVLVGVALVEEAAKRGFLHLRARRDRHLEQPFDWIVYAVTVSLGFATVENVLYVYTHGAATGFWRAVTAVPAHAFFGTIMGWRLARAAVLAGAEARRERRLALFEPALWHAAYDLPLFASDVALPGLFLAVFSLVLFVLWRVSAARVAAMARAQHHPSPPLLALDELARRMRAARKPRPG